MRVLSTTPFSRHRGDVTAVRTGNHHSVIAAGLAAGFLAITLSGCGGDNGAGGSIAIVDSSAPTTSGSGSCGYYDVDGCSVFGLVMVDPLPTAEASAAVADLGGVPIAVWRTDYVCIFHYSMPVGPTYGVPSRFAYVDADNMRERILAAEGSVAPPITGLDSWNRQFDAYLQEWSKAQEPGVLIEAIAVYLPVSMQASLTRDPRFRTVVLLSSSRTESTDPSYTGELMVDDSPPLSEPPEPDCG
jgi:hypothetical protein